MPVAKGPAKMKPSSSIKQLRREQNKLTISEQSDFLRGRQIITKSKLPSVADLLKRGLTARKLRSMNYDVKKLIDLGYTYSDVRALGFLDVDNPVEDVVRFKSYPNNVRNYDPLKLRSEKLKQLSLKGVRGKHLARELSKSGYDLKGLRDYILKGKYTSRELREKKGISLARQLDIGVSLDKIIESGYNKLDLEKDGARLANIAFNIDSKNSDGLVSVNDLKRNLLIPKLKTLGYGPKEIYDVTNLYGESREVDRSDLLKLLGVNYKIKDLIRSDFKVADLIVAGYDIKLISEELRIPLLELVENILNRKYYQVYFPGFYLKNLPKGLNLTRLKVNMTDLAFELGIERLISNHGFSKRIILAKGFDLEFYLRKFIKNEINTPILRGLLMLGYTPEQILKTSRIPIDIKYFVDAGVKLKDLLFLPDYSLKFAGYTKEEINLARSKSAGRAHA